MTDATAAAILAELAHIRAVLERLAPPALDGRQTALLTALEAVYGSAPFTAAEALETAQTPIGDRRALAAALKAVGASGAASLGMTFATIAKRSAGQPLRLVRAGSEAGSRLWAVEGGG
jgi:hypothetical protein